MGKNDAFFLKSAIGRPPQGFLADFGPLAIDLAQRPFTIRDVKVACVFFKFVGFIGLVAQVVAVADLRRANVAPACLPSAGRKSRHPGYSDHPHRKGETA
jgi:hypothetical protein